MMSLLILACHVEYTVLHARMQPHVILAMIPMQFSHQVYANARLLWLEFLEAIYANPAILHVLLAVELNKINVSHVLAQPIFN